MENLKWSPEMVLGVPNVDALHQSLVETLAALRIASDEKFPHHYNILIADMEHDFYEEERQMEEIGFAALHAHREQHARVLGAMHQAQGHVMCGDIQAAREVIAILPQWFTFHLSTMDAELAIAIRLDAEQKQSEAHENPGA
jgi:hemerythrin